MVWEVAVGMVAKVVRGIIMAVLLMVVFTYGDAHLPCELGSGSGNDNSAAIAGGGIIVMGSLEHSLPTLSIDGSLKADGESFGENTIERDGVIISNVGPRGGSGGIILLFVHALAIGNSSIISTVGGNGSPHGGGDGRVHFRWADIPIANRRGSIHTGISPSQSSLSSQDRAGPPELSFSESMKSRLNSVSTRYKESISKSTRGWKERFFSRTMSIADLGSEVKREVSVGLATVSCMRERLDTKENSSTSTAPMSSSSEDTTVLDQGNQRMFETGGSNHLSDTNVQASHAGTTGLH